MTHELKTDPAVFAAVFSGEKNFEIRKNDRGFQVGDKLLLRETVADGADMAPTAANRQPLQYTGRKFKARVTYILNGPIYGLEAGWCIMSFEPIGTLRAQVYR